MRVPLCLCVTVLALRTQGPARADTDFTTWSISTSVTDTSNSAILRDLRYSNSVQNPFSTIHQVQIPTAPNSAIHTASAHYNASWLVAESIGRFDLSYEESVDGPDSYAVTGGTLYFQSDVDLHVNYSGTMTFSSSPADEADFFLNLYFRLPTTPPTLMGGTGVQGGTGSFGLPASGTRSFARSDLLLPGGATYRISFEAETSMFNLNQQPHQPLLSSGSIHFDWRPVPEPAAILLSLAVIVIGARRRPARRKPCCS